MLFSGVTTCSLAAGLDGRRHPTRSVEPFSGGAMSELDGSEESWEALGESNTWSLKLIDVYHFSMGRRMSMHCDFTSVLNVSVTYHLATTIACVSWEDGRSVDTEPEERASTRLGVPSSSVSFIEMEDFVER